MSIPLRYGTTSGGSYRLSFRLSQRVSIPLRYGTTLAFFRSNDVNYGQVIQCQFLLGTVQQQQSFPAITDIVLYFFQKFNHFYSKKSVDLFSCLTLIISI